VHGRTANVATHLSNRAVYGHRNELLELWLLRKQNDRGIDLEIGSNTAQDKIVGRRIDRHWASTERIGGHRASLLLLLLLLLHQLLLLLQLLLL